MRTNRVMVLLGLLVVTGCSSRPEPEPVWVGHLVPLSGADRQVGERSRQAVALALEDARAAGWSAAGRPVMIRHADAAGDASTVRAQTARLLSVNRVIGLIAGPGVEYAAEVVRTARPYGTVVVVPGELPVAQAADAITLGAGPTRRGQVLARHAAGPLKASRAAVLLDNADPVAGDLVEAFTKEWGKRPLTQLTVTAMSDPADLARRALEAKPDVMLYAGPAAQLGRWREALRKAGGKGPLLFGGEDRGVEPVARLGGAEPVYLATAVVTEGLGDRGKEFARRFASKFKDPPDFDAFQAHDAAYLLLEALNEVNAPGVKLREYLARKADFESATGPVSWVNALPKRKVFVVRVQGEERAVVHTALPDE